MKDGRRKKIGVWNTSIATWLIGILRCIIEGSFPPSGITPGKNNNKNLANNLNTSDLVVCSPVNDIGDTKGPYIESSDSEVTRQTSERAQLRQELNRVMEDFKQLTQETTELRICKICFEQEINCVLLNCGHLAVCLSCANSMVQRVKAYKAECPICRQPVQRVVETHWS